MPCSTSLATPSDLTPPLFAVHLCTSRRTGVKSAPSGVVVLQPCVSSCPGESPLSVCTCHRFDSSFRALLLSLLKLVKMLPFSAQSTYRLQSHPIPQWYSIYRFQLAECVSVPPHYWYSNWSPPPVQLMRLITALFKAKIREHRSTTAEATLINWLTRNSQVIITL